MKKKQSNRHRHVIFYIACEILNLQSVQYSVSEIIKKMILYLSFLDSNIG